MKMSGSWSNHVALQFGVMIAVSVNSYVGGNHVSWGDSPSGPGPPHYWGFEIVLRRMTSCRTLLDE